MTLALYLHIPFCRRKCRYCDFPSVDRFPCTMDGYVTALLRELELVARALAEAPVARTLYLGGGTPSLLSPGQVARLVAAARLHYRLAPDAEVTMEVNPGTVTGESLSGYRAAGVNRLSIGVQSLDDAMLQQLGRIHTSAEARRAMALARGAGFDNIGIDLIHGLPGQSPEGWGETLQGVAELAPEHVSAYGLTVEEGTPFGELAARGELALPDEDAAARMLEETGDVLIAAGLEQYEIANFARPGYRSRHNQVYWRRGSYLGFGPGAHSFLASPGWGVRWRCPADIPGYLAAMAAGRPPEADRLELDRADAASETMFLGLRLLEGVDEAAFAARFGEGVEALFPAASRLLALGMLERSAGKLRLARAALPVANQVFGAFV